MTLDIFKKVIHVIHDIEAGINEIEEALNCHIDKNWMTDSSSHLEDILVESFCSDNNNVDDVYEVVGRVIYGDALDSYTVTFSGIDKTEELIIDNIDDLYNFMVKAKENPDDDIFIKKNCREVSD